MSVIFVFCLTYSSDFISVEKKKKKLRLRFRGILVLCIFLVTVIFVYSSDSNKYPQYKCTVVSNKKIKKLSLIYTPCL